MDHEHQDDVGPPKEVSKPTEAKTQKQAETNEIEGMTDAVDEFSRNIDINLRAFRGQFARLSDAILEHTEKVQRGEFEDVEIGTILKRIDPVLNLSIQQETKLNDKLAERVGKAGKFAIDFDEARSEIWSRLARLRAAGRVAGVSGRDA